MLKKKLNNKKAFTLIEMVIVLFIISLLTLLILPNMNSARNTADEVTGEALIGVVQTQAEIYKADTGEYPASLDALNGYLTPQQIDQAGENGITISNGEVNISAGSAQ